MCLRRRLMNLIVENRLPGAKSLSCVDLWSQLFGDAIQPKSTIGDGCTILQGNTTTTPATDAINRKDKLAKAAALQRIQLPSPIYTFQGSSSDPNEPCKMDCFPLDDGKMIWADHLGRSFLSDVETCFVELLPNLHKPKCMPFSLFVRNDEADYNYEDNLFGSTLFVMEKIPAPEAACDMPQSYQFEAFVYRLPSTEIPDSKSWVCQLLPPPPFVREPKCWPVRPVISSYAVVDGGRHICISADHAGSYCLSTEDHTWSKVGKWRTV